MDPLSVLAWTLFYMVIVAMFYWCFRQSMSGVRDGNPTATTSPDGATTAGATNATTTADEQRSGRQIYSMPGPGRNVYVISDEMRINSSNEPPPDYKWEDLPPSYEDAVQLYSISSSSLPPPPPPPPAAAAITTTQENDDDETRTTTPV